MDMRLEKVILLSNLFDLYGVLLTQKQQQIFKCYYFDDISLSEIAQMYDISKQAVKDSLDKSQKILLEYEDKLNIQSKLDQTDKVLSGCGEEIKKQIKKIWKEN